MKLKEIKKLTFNQVTWVELRNHNGDFWTYFKLNGQWYYCRHTEGFLEPGCCLKEMSEESVQRVFNSRFDEGILLEAEDASMFPKSGQSALCLNVGSDWKDHKQMFRLDSGEDEDTEIWASPVQVAQMIEDGTIDDKISENYPE